MIRRKKVTFNAYTFFHELMVRERTRQEPRLIISWLINLNNLLLSAFIVYLETSSIVVLY